MTNSKIKDNNRRIIDEFLNSLKISKIKPLETPTIEDLRGASTTPKGMYKNRSEKLLESSNDQLGNSLFERVIKPIRKKAYWEYRIIEDESKLKYERRKTKWVPRSKRYGKRGLVKPSHRKINLGGVKHGKVKRRIARKAKRKVREKFKDKLAMDRKTIYYKYLYFKKVMLKRFRDLYRVEYEAHLWNKRFDRERNEGYVYKWRWGVWNTDTRKDFKKEVLDRFYKQVFLLSFLDYVEIWTKAGKVQLEDGKEVLAITLQGRSSLKNTWIKRIDPELPFAPWNMCVVYKKQRLC